jgi:hypothetical protein
MEVKVDHRSLACTVARCVLVISRRQGAFFA